MSDKPRPILKLARAAPVPLQAQIDALTKRVKFLEGCFDAGADFDKAAIGGLQKAHRFSPRQQSLLESAGYLGGTELAKRADDPGPEYRAALEALGVADTPELRKFALAGQERRRDRAAAHPQAADGLNKLARHVARSSTRVEAELAVLRDAVGSLDGIRAGIDQLEKLKSARPSGGALH